MRQHRTRNLEILGCAIAHHSSRFACPGMTDQGFSCTVPSAKPRAMNRTGLFIALSLALVIGLVFGIYPELDLKLASLFYDPQARAFPLKQDWLASFARDGAMWIAWGLAAPAAADVGPRDFVPAADADDVRGRAHQLHLQDLLGPATSGLGGRVQWRTALRGLVGPARPLRAQLL